MINRGWLFVCSCIALVTSAFTFIVRGDVLQDMGNAFGLTQGQKGDIEGAVFLGMALSMLIGGFICDYLGMKNMLIFAFLSHLFGSLGTIFAPQGEYSYYVLYGASMLMGFGNGFTEVGINPLVATMFPDKKTHYLNILHAWWPGGLVIGGILARLVGKGLDLTIIDEIPGLGVNWQLSLCLIAGPAAIYGLMLLPAKFPQTERVASGVTTGEMFKECLRPLFLVWAFCMLLTAATELGPQKWQESVIPNIAGVSGTLVLVYTSGMMFILRHFAGPIAHKISPVGMMAGSALLSATGLYLLSTATNPATVFGYATIFGLGIAYFWPTMLGFTAERFPKGGALALALMGSFGNVSISQVLPQMGRFVDRFGVEEFERLDGAARDAIEGSLDRDSEKVLIVKAAAGATDLRAAQIASGYADKGLQTRLAFVERVRAFEHVRDLYKNPEPVDEEQRKAAEEKYKDDPEIAEVRDAIANDEILKALETEVFAPPPPAGGGFGGGFGPPGGFGNANPAPKPTEAQEAARDMVEKLTAVAARHAGKLAEKRMTSIVDEKDGTKTLSVDAIAVLEEDFFAAMLALYRVAPDQARGVCPIPKTGNTLKAYADAAVAAPDKAALQLAFMTDAPADVEALSDEDRLVYDRAAPLKAKAKSALAVRGAVDFTKLQTIESAQAPGAQAAGRSAIAGLLKLRIAKAAQATGFSMAFRMVCILPALLIVIFTAIILYDRSRGGYKAEVLSQNSH